MTIWLQRGVRVHIRHLAQLELSQWKPLFLLMAVFNRVCPLSDLSKRVLLFGLSLIWEAALCYVISSRSFLLIRKSSDKTASTQGIHSWPFPWKRFGMLTH